MEISSLEPEDFCQKVNLCEQVAFISKHLKKDSCEFCRNAVAEALLKLKDPETEVRAYNYVLIGGVLTAKDICAIYKRQCRHKPNL